MEILIKNRMMSTICMLQDILTNQFENLRYKFLGPFQLIQLLKCKDRIKTSKKNKKIIKITLAIERKCRKMGLD